MHNTHQKIIFAFFVSLCFSLPSFAQEQLFKSFNKLDDQGFEVLSSEGSYLFHFLTPKVVEVSFYTSTEALPKSHAVVHPNVQVEVQVEETKNHIHLQSEGIQVHITKSPFQISYFFEGNHLIEHKNGFAKDRVYIDFEVEETEVLMGGGSRALGMNRRGHRLPLYNRAHYGYETRSEQMNFALPIVFSSKKYLLHFDNPTTGHLDLDSQFNNTLAFEAYDGAKRFQLIAGENWEQILHEYTELTGKQPMPARWTLGNFASRFGYHSQAETEMTVDKFRQEEIPLDAIILDLYWFGHEVTGTMGNLAFVKDSFPNPKKMMKNLKKDGVNTILITEPFMLKTANRWEEALQEDILAKDSLGDVATYDFFFGHTALIDVFNPNTKAWFWNIYNDLKKQGATGWWGDLGEPEVHPEHLMHYGNQRANEVHNIFGNEWASIIFDHYRKEYPTERPFILMRAGYSGAQKYGMIPWSGDVNRTWGGLQPQMEISLQMGMQGLAYMHSDLGGFAGDLLDDELYVRWLQYGVFQPIFRPHAQEDVASEPVFRSREAMELSKKAIELRYQLLPYNYHLAYENSTLGKPLMRPLFWEADTDLKAYHTSQSYFWGKDFFISPVIQKGRKSQRIDFPNNSNWVDFYTHEVFEGGTQVSIELHEEYIPTYVRGGAFIPLAPLVQTTRDYTFDNLHIKYFYDEEVGTSKRSFFNDNGEDATSIANENYEVLHLQFHEVENVLQFQVAIEEKNYKTSFKQFHLEVINFEKPVKEVLVNNKRVKFQQKENTIRLEDIKLASKKSTITIKF